MTDETAPRPREAPLYDLIYGVLADHIRDNRLRNGLVLGEVGISRAFGTSRMPAAAALKRLAGEGLVQPFAGRGYLVGDGAPVRLDLLEAGLVLPPGVIEDVAIRNISARLYPEVEHTVASVLGHGRFLLNESALAEHYGMSRAIAHEMLTRMERAGLINQDTNQRWHAGPLTPELMRHHFEMRWLLEPEALRQVAPGLGRDELLRKRGHVERLRNGHEHPELLERIEYELHIELIQRCENAPLLHAVRRSQLPVLATHSTYRRTQAAQEIITMAREHLVVFDLLLDGDGDGAARALEAHLRRAAEHNIGLLKSLPALPQSELPPYLTPLEPGAIPGG